MARKNILKNLILAAVLFAPINSFAQNESIANLPAPATGSLNLSYGDIVPATRGGNQGLGGGTTYGMVIGFGGSCSVGEYVSSISNQGVPNCGIPNISTTPTFTIASGCGSPTSLTGGATTGSFLAGQASCAPVINLPTAPHGWYCRANDITHPADLFTQTATSTTSCTITSTVTTSDQILFTAEGY